MAHQILFAFNRTLGKLPGTLWTGRGMSEDKLEEIQRRLIANNKGDGAAFATMAKSAKEIGDKLKQESRTRLIENSPPLPGAQDSMCGTLLYLDPTQMPACDELCKLVTEQSGLPVQFGEFHIDFYDASKKSKDRHLIDYATLTLRWSNAKKKLS